MVGAGCLQQLPLLRRQLVANGQQKTGIRLFEIGSGLRHFVNLRKDLRLIRMIAAHQRLHLQLGPLQAGAQVDQLLPVLQ